MVIIDVFDEQHVIPFLLVKQLIDQILGQQNPISARTNPLRLAVIQMAQGIILRTVPAVSRFSFKENPSPGSLMRMSTRDAHGGRQSRFAVREQISPHAPSR